MVIAIGRVFCELPNKGGSSVGASPRRRFPIGKLERATHSTRATRGSGKVLLRWMLYPILTIRRGALTT